MKIRIFLIFCLCVPLNFVYAQVGIQTNQPQSDLDVNGDVSLRQELRLKGTSTVTGNPGQNGQVLFSQDGTNEPMWKFVNVPYIEEGQIQLKYSFAVVDQVGIDFPSGAGDLDELSSLGESLNSTWTQIPGLATQLEIKKSLNKVALIFQTGVEMLNTYNPEVDVKNFVRYICGVFQNDILVAVRADQVNSSNNKNSKNQGLYTLSYILTNVPVGEHTYKVACRKIKTSTGGNYPLAIGKTLVTGAQVANNFMLSSNLKIDVMEYVVNE
ncbi:hypothetical protein [Moheibacter stercoris]|uniref:Uncharacterized protein n=1 Tax=Moheibacter stercoris TaxID=1628251 RepID=A0ABV2LZ66_9FLAO